jgi:hypothetical protein
MDVPALTGTAGISAAERVFDLGQLGEPLGVLARGILVMHAVRAPARARADGSGGHVVAASGQRYLVHVPQASGPLASAGLAAVRRNRTAGAALHLGGDADTARLPLEFAAHLGDRRRRDAHPVRPCVTSATAPELASAPDLVRLPHLLTVRGGAGVLADAVIWEVMTITQARRWLGGPLPCQPFFEQQLPALLHLRFLARTGQFPASTGGQRLRELITGRYLSIRLVYRHPALFAALIGAAGARPAPAGEDG